MRLQIIKSKNAQSFYVVKSTYINGVHSSKVVEKLGTLEQVKLKANGDDPYVWAKEYVAKLTKQYKTDSKEIIKSFSPTKIMEKGKKKFNGGYLFLQKIYYEIGLDKICKNITNKYKFDFDLNDILSKLIYSRIIYPSSKLSTYEHSKNFLEQPKFDLHQIYRALEIINKEDDFIQSELYKNSSSIVDRNTKILYYDCTNYFFEIEQEDGIKQYGVSKEHRPNPIVQMGLFMDGNGIPLAFSINPGNTNEQLTLKPLEEKILNDFKLSKFVVCTDAGLASNSNRKFNTQGDRSYITTQPIKKLKAHLKEWATSNDGWHTSNGKKLYDISKLDEEKCKDIIFYKERWINENDLEQKLIVSYSVKYRDYQRSVRNGQINRAIKTIETNPNKLKKCNSNDYKRFIQKTSCTNDGEVAEKNFYSINSNLVQYEESYDGFYAVCTNLEGNTSDIIKINHDRWEIEECFRIMKSEFKARPVYLAREDRIKAHFSICFIALMIYRILEKILDEKYTCNQLIDTLKEMNFYELKGEGYIPLYEGGEITDDLHSKFGFRTDYQILTNKEIKNIFKISKK